MGLQRKEREIEQRNRTPFQWNDVPEDGRIRELVPVPRKEEKKELPFDADTEFYSRAPQRQYVFEERREKHCHPLLAKLAQQLEQLASTKEITQEAVLDALETWYGSSDSRKEILAKAKTEELHEILKGVVDTLDQQARRAEAKVLIQTIEAEQLKLTREYFGSHEK